jgi:hypothetical protein
MMYLHRYMFALIKPELKQQWNLGNDQLGYLDSAFSLCYDLPGSSRRRGRRRRSSFDSDTADHSVVGGAGAARMGSVRQR